LNKKKKTMKLKVEQALNLQIDREAYSSHLYLSMAVWAEAQGYNGTSKWLYAQALEERNHLVLFIQYVNGRGGKVLIPQINQPPQEWESVQSLFNQVLEHERFITDSINEIVAICSSEKDFTTLNWLQFFVNEQIEEENSVKAIIDNLKLLGNNNMYLFDRDVFAMRTQTAAQ